MRYQTYQFAASKILKKVTLTPEIYDTLLSEVIRQHKLMGQGHPITGVGTLAERDLLVAGKPTLFVETPELAESAYLCGYNIEINFIDVPGGITAISFPEGTVVNGFSMVPMFVGFLPDLLEKVYKPLGDPTIGLEGVKPLVIGFPDECGYAVLKVATQADLDKFFSGDADLRYSYDNPLNPPSDLEKVQKRLMTQARVALGLLAYLQAFPGMLVPGFPESMKERDIRTSLVDGIGKKKRHLVGKTIRLHPDFVEHKSPHWRRGHMRCLRAERFTKNSNGSVRITHVKGCFVQGRAIKPSTALDL